RAPYRRSGRGARVSHHGGRPMTATLLELPLSSGLASLRRNAASVEVMMDALRLPGSRPVGREDAAHVAVTTLDDLAVWMLARGGRITVHPSPHGVDLWILHTTADGMPG